jgi:hypothetical protein
MCMNDEKRLKSWGLLFEVVWGGGGGRDFTLFPF